MCQGPESFRPKKNALPVHFMNQKDVIVLAKTFSPVLQEKNAFVQLIAFHTGRLLIIPSQYPCQDLLSTMFDDEQHRQASRPFRTPEWYDERVKGGTHK
jgi:hypothetical protein